MKRGTHHSDETKRKIGLTSLGRLHSTQTKLHLSKVQKAKHITSQMGKERMEKGWERILVEAAELEKQGFHVIPITRVVPDIIAIKDGKVFAVEVEYRDPDYGKYTDDVRRYFDDIIWIVRKK